MAVHLDSLFSLFCGCCGAPPPATARARARPAAQTALAHPALARPSVIGAAREQLSGEASTLRESAEQLLGQTRALALQVDHLVALEVENGYAPAPASRLQADLERLLPPPGGRTVAPHSPTRRAEVPKPPPVTAQTPQAVAAAIVASPAFAEDYAWAYLEHARVSFVPVAPQRYLNPFRAAPPVVDLRDHVYHAKLALGRLLPATAQAPLDTTMMHFGHEVLRVAYRNRHTIVLEEPVADIPRAYFLVTDDKYAWDVRELVQAITANGGVFKNPLDHMWFTAHDIKAILAHPSGAELRKTRAKQEALRNGVRRESAAALQKLGTALMNDRANDGRNAVASANAIAEFHAYMASLPEEEQHDLQALPTSGVDTHNGAVFNSSTVQQVLQDTATCFHKRGDLLAQTAGALLRRMGRA